MPLYVFSQCSIIGYRDISINNDSQPPRAEVDFVVFVYVDATKTRFDYKGSAQRRVILTFEKEADGEWYVVDYAHMAPNEADYRDANGRLLRNAHRYGRVKRPKQPQIRTDAGNLPLRHARSETDR